MRKKRISLWIGGVLAVLILLFVIAIPLAREPLRRYVENTMNENLEGYSVELGSISYRPISAVILHDLLIFQDAHPDPPVADIPYLRASLHWRQILRARLVADFKVENPNLHLNLEQLREEMEEEVPADERGWQEAVQAIYPFRVNVITIREGELVYIDEDPDQPLHLEDIFFEAINIRNIVSPDATYPSSFRLESVIFGEGRLLVDGNADFLQEPYPGVDTQVEITGIPLDPIRPVLSRYNIFIRNGEFAASGHIEHSPQVRRYEFDSVEISDIHLDYRYQGPDPEADENDTTEAVMEAVTAGPPGEEEFLYRVENLRVTGIVGIVNTETDPQYRLFLDPFDLRINQLSNDIRLGTTTAELSGMFMGSGRTSASAALRPEETDPEFYLDLTIEETHMPAMNDLLMAYGGFDVTEGQFSLVMEIRVEDQRVDGYVEPFLKDMTVLDPDEDKDFAQQFYEGVVDALSILLENIPRDEVATRAYITGELDDPEVSTWEIVGNLIRNAFFEAIIPRFEEEAEQ